MIYDFERCLRQASPRRCAAVPADSAPPPADAAHGNDEAADRHDEAAAFLREDDRLLTRLEHGIFLLILGLIVAVGAGMSYLLWLCWVRAW